MTNSDPDCEGDDCPEKPKEGKYKASAWNQVEWEFDFGWISVSGGARVEYEKEVSEDEAKEMLSSGWESYWEAVGELPWASAKL